MKTVLAVAAALGLSVSVAGACPMKRDTTASIDKETTTASLQTPIPAPATVKDKKAQ